MSRPSDRRPHENDPRRGRRLGVERLESRVMLAGDLELVRDINISPQAINYSKSPTVVGENLYFTTDPVYPVSPDASNAILWKSEISSGVATRIAEFPASTSNSNLHFLTNVSGTLFFVANDGVSGHELWKSDGTSSGTVRVKDIRLGANEGELAELTNVGGILFFVANDGIVGAELWKSDGTDAGTSLVRDIAPLSSSSYPRNLVEHGGALFFVANDSVHGAEVWKSDGATATTEILKNIRTGELSSEPGNLTSIGGNLYFTANDGFSGQELWRSNGVESGTVLFKDVFSGPGSSSPRSFSKTDSQLFFLANDGAGGFEFWKSDGTATGTLLVKEISPGAASTYIHVSASVGSTLYFVATKQQFTAIKELWKSDGTELGTVPVSNVVAEFHTDALNDLENINGTLFFAGIDSTNGIELWKSDGTDTGTAQVIDIAAGWQSSRPTNLTSAGGTLFFAAWENINGQPLWKSNGTSSGTFRITDSAPANSSGSPSSIVSVGSTIYFIAQISNELGIGLWKSDGTEAGTVLIRSIYPGVARQYSHYLYNANGTLFFSVVPYTRDNGEHVSELWKSDGTAAGTLRVKQFAPDSRFYEWEHVGGTLYLNVNDGVTGRNLWKSDGSEAGTVLVKDIKPGPGQPYLTGLTSVGSTLYFKADNGVRGSELWKSDGTLTGTVPVKDAALIARYPRFPQNIGGTLFFLAIPNGTNYELWKSDGTDVGTLRVSDVNLGRNGYPSTQLINVSGTLFFTGNDGVYGREIWKSDGTTAGTGRVTNFQTSAPSAWFSHAGQLYFTINSGVSSTELWRTDGTQSGTVFVTNIPSTSRYPLVADGTLFYTSYDYIPIGGYYYTNRRLWMIALADGDANPIEAPGGKVDFFITSFGGFEFPPPYAVADKRLFVSGYRVEIGKELFAIDLAIAGDYNRDGEVNHADYTVWAAHVGASNNLGLNADGNDDGLIDTADYTVWRDHLGDFIDDHGNTPSTGTNSGLLGSIEGVISTATDYDWFKLSTQPGFQHRALLNLNGLASGTVRVFGSDGLTLVASDIDGGQASVAWTPTDQGPYFIEIAGIEGSYGSYSLTFARDDHGESIETATNATTPSSNPGNILSPTDADWFKHLALAGYEYRANLQLSGLASGTIRVYGPDGTTILTTATSSSSQVVTWKADVAGNYYIQVTGDAGSTGAYTLNLSRDDHGGDPVSATQSFSYQTAGEIWSPTDVDWIKIYAYGGYENRAQLLLSGLTSGTMRVFGADGVSLIASDVDGGAAELLWTPTSDGYYFIELAGLAGALGAYSLRIDRDDITGTTATSSYLSSQSTSGGEIWSATDRDWFRIDAITGFEYRVQMTLSTLASGNLRIYAQDGVTLVASDNDGGAASLVFLATTTGSYYAEVVSHEGATGSYALTLQIDDHSAAVALARQVNVPSTTTGEIWSATDRDWLAISATSGFEYRATFALNTLTNGSLRVYGPDGVTVLASDVDGGAASVVWLASVSGLYYVEVTGFEGALGTYSVSLTRDDRSASTSASTVSVPSSTTGQIWSATDADWFRIDASEGFEYRAQLTLNTLPSGALRVYGPDGMTLLVSDIDGGSATVFWTPITAGTYYVEVTGVAGELGSYSLGMARDDRAQIASAASAQNVPSSLTGEIWSATDVDWFAFFVNAGTEYRVQVTPNTLTNSGLRIYAPNRVTLVGSDIDGGSASVLWTPTVSDYYYVEVSGVAGSMGTFGISAARDDHSNIFSAATAIGLPNSTTAEIWSPTDTEFFSFTVVAGTEYRAELLMAGLGSGTLRVLGSNGTTLITSDTSTSKAAVVWTASAAGTNYLQVSGDAGAIGFYRLTVDRDPLNQTAATATTISTPSTTTPSVYSAIIGTGADRDWYRIATTQNFEYRVQLTGWGLTNGGVRISAPDGTTVVASDVDGGGADLIWAATLSGSYYLEVFGVDGATGAYTLTVSREDHGGASARATSLTISTTAVTTAGLIGPPADADWFRVNNQFIGDYRAQLNLNGLASGRLRIFAPDGASVVASDLDGGAADILWTAALSGTYFVEVTGDGVATGAYSLVISREDHGGAAVSATILTAPTTTTSTNTVGTIGFVGDRDWFSFAAVANTKYRLQVNLNGLNSAATRVTTSSGQLLVASDVDGGGASLTWAAPSIGTYYVEIVGAGGATGAYSLGLALDDHPGTSATAREIAPVSATTGEIGGINDRDWFKVLSPPSSALIREYRAQLSLNGLASGGVRVYAPDQETLVATYIAGSAEWLVWPVTLSGFYYLEVFGVGGAMGTYSLVLALEDHPGIPNLGTGVSIPSSTAGQIGFAGDTDWFRFLVSALGSSYNLSLALGTLTGTALRLYGPDATTLLGSDLDSGPAALTFTPTTIGTYYVEVAPFDNALGTYTFGVAVAPPIAIASAAVSQSAALAPTIPAEQTEPVTSVLPRTSPRWNERSATSYQLAWSSERPRSTTSSARDEAFAALATRVAASPPRRLRSLSPEIFARLGSRAAGVDRP